MSEWAYVNGEFEIQEVHGILPKNWRNVSNLHAFENTPEILQSLGWYPVVDTTQPIDILTQTYGPVEYTFDRPQNVVTKNSPVVAVENPITQEQLFASQRQDFLSQLLQIVQRRLQESDWTQLPDVQEDKGTAWVSLWKDYRKQLRGLLEQYATPEYQHVIHINDVVWPSQPDSNN